MEVGRNTCLMGFAFSFNRLLSFEDLLMFAFSYSEFDRICAVSLLLALLVQNDELWFSVYLLKTAARNLLLLNNIQLSRTVVLHPRNKKSRRIFGKKNHCKRFSNLEISKLYIENQW